MERVVRMNIDEVDQIEIFKYLGLFYRMMVVSDFGEDMKYMVKYGLMERIKESGILCDKMILIRLKSK